jgi:hypothetical protein
VIKLAGKERLIKNLHKIVREDPYINELCNSSGIELDEIERVLNDIYNQYWFDTMTWGADIVAKQLKVKLDSTMTQADKNSLLEARWKASGKSDVFLLQTICDSWKNGEIDVFFTNGRIQVKFVGEYGVPSDLDSLKSELNKSKPAHLAIDYLFKYLLVKDVHNMTVNELQLTTINKFAGGGN